MQLRLQKCKPTDLDLLVKISRKTFEDAFEKANEPIDFKNYTDQAFSRDTLLRELNNTDTSFYFVFKDIHLSGYFRLNENQAQTDLKSKETIELERLYVLENFQGQQIGKWMLDEVKQIAFEKQKEFLWLGVWEENGKAIKFYEKHGFSKFAKHPYYIGKDKQTDWLMRYAIKNDFDSE